MALRDVKSVIVGDVERGDGWCLYGWYPPAELLDLAADLGVPDRGRPVPDRVGFAVARRLQPLVMSC